MFKMVGVLARLKETIKAVSKAAKEGYCKNKNHSRLGKAVPFWLGYVLRNVSIKEGVLAKEFHTNEKEAVPSHFHISSSC